MPPHQPGSLASLHLPFPQAVFAAGWITRKPEGTTTKLRRCGLWLLLTVLLGCDLGDGGGGADAPFRPTPGLPRYQKLGAIPVPGGVISPAGGNYMHRRIDFTIDTRIGTREVGAVYNTADDRWRWSWEMKLSQGGNLLVDDTGASYSLFSNFIAGDRLFPGGHWVRVDATHIRSIGGLVHEFYGTGKLKAIYWQSADYPRLAYRTSQPFGGGVHTRVEQCLSATECELVYTIERNFFARVTALVDRAGRRAEFTYDAQGHLATARDPLDVANGWAGRRYSWWGPRLVAITNSEDERIEIGSAWMSGQVTLVRQIGAPNRNHRFTYGRIKGPRPKGTPSQFTSYRDPEGHMTTIHVDGYRCARIVKKSSGATTNYFYTPRSFELNAIQHADGTRIEYDFEGETRVIRTDPSGNATRIDVRLDAAEDRQHPFLRPIAKIEDDLGLIEERGYDAQGRLVWLENGEGDRTTFTYDAGNQLASITLPSGVTTTLSDYGAHGQPETLTVGGETQTRSFDAVGNLLAENGLDVMDGRSGGVLEREYDADRNPTTVWLAESDPAAPEILEHAITTSYRSDGQPLAITRPGGGDHEFTYDLAGQLVERRERVGGVWQSTLFEADRLGRTTAETLPNGMRREESYTEDGQLAGVRNLRDAVVETEATLSWENGRLVEIDDAAHGVSETIDYDSAGRPGTITFPGGESLALEYDGRNRRTREEYILPGGSTLRVLHFGFDLANRSASLDDGSGNLLTLRYAGGRPDEIDYGNGLTESFAYDAVTGLLDMRTLSAAGNVVAFSSITQSLETASEAVAVRLFTASPFGIVAEAHDLGFDAATGVAGKRLLRSQGQELAYDALSNLMHSGAQTADYNAEGNRIESVTAGTGGVTDYSSDAAGYMTARGSVGLSWTAAGRIAAIGDDVFDWDAFGRPTLRRVDGVERQLAFGGRVETDAQGVPMRIDLRAVSLELDSGATRYRHADYRGNVDLITDGAGEVVAHYTYSAYGVATLAGTDDGAVTFAQGRLVQDLVVLGPRVHDPHAGRFLAPDPIFQLASQFTYTAGNPISWWDPSGLEEAPTANQLMFNGTINAAVIGKWAVIYGGLALLGVVPGGQLVGGAFVMMGIDAIEEGVRGYLRGRKKARARGKSKRGSGSAPNFGKTFDDLNVGDWSSGDLMDFRGCPRCGPNPPGVAEMGSVAGPGGFGGSFGGSFGSGGF